MSRYAMIGGSAADIKDYETVEVCRRRVAELPRTNHGEDFLAEMKRLEPFEK